MHSGATCAPRHAPPPIWPGRGHRAARPSIQAAICQVRACFAGFELVRVSVRTSTRSTARAGIPDKAPPKPPLHGAVTGGAALIYSSRGTAKRLCVGCAVEVVQHAKRGHASRMLDGCEQGWGVREKGGSCVRCLAKPLCRFGLHCAFVRFALWQRGRESCVCVRVGCLNSDGPAPRNSCGPGDAE